MTRKQFDQLVADALASLPAKYRSLLTNVAILVEDFPAAQTPLDRAGSVTGSVGAGFRDLRVPEFLPGSPAPASLPGAGDEDEDDLLMGEFIGVPRTEHALWDMPPEPARVVLYRKNIEAYAADCAADDPSGPSLDEIIREEVRLTLLHELGHFFGLDESALEDV